MYCIHYLHAVGAIDVVLKSYVKIQRFIVNAYVTIWSKNNKWWTNSLLVSLEQKAKSMKYFQMSHALSLSRTNHLDLYERAAIHIKLTCKIFYYLLYLMCVLCL